jgi:hypothetical protein
VDVTIERVIKALSWALTEWNVEQFAKEVYAADYAAANDGRKKYLLEKFGVFGNNPLTLYWKLDNDNKLRMRTALQQIMKEHGDER